MVEIYVGGSFSVGRGVRVGILVGVRATTVPVRVGTFVGTSVRVGTRVGVFVNALCSGGRVAVPSSVRVGFGVIVLLGVEVGVAEMRGVAVSVEEAVLVGTVMVGNGPSRACMVPAMAVLILSTCWELSPRPNTPLLLKREPNPTKTNPIHKSS
jgi:hypothetical protein